MTKDERIEKIRELGIFELRGLARQLGIPSPTTKKREELIDGIADALSNNEGIKSTGKRKGRPFKEVVSIKNILNSINEIEETFDEMNYSTALTFAQEIPNFSLENSDLKEYNFSGYARVGKEYISFIDIRTNSWVFIKNSKDFSKIRVGDKIQVIAKRIGTSNQFECEKILAINDIKIDDYKPNKPTEFSVVISKDTIPFASKSIIKGRRNATCLEEDIFENNNLKDLAQYCKDNNTKLVVLGLNTSYEDQIYLNNTSNFENFTTEYGTSDYINANKVLDSINLFKNLIDNGQNCLLFIMDIMEVVRTLNKFSASKNIGCDLEKNELALVVLKELFSSTKALENNGASTLLMCYRYQDKTNEFLQNEILRISKNID